MNLLLSNQSAKTIVVGKNAESKVVGEHEKRMKLPVNPVLLAVFTRQRSLVFVKSMPYINRTAAYVLLRLPQMHVRSLQWLTYNIIIIKTRKKPIVFFN